MIETKSPLGMVIGHLLRAVVDLAEDPISASVGFTPDPTPTLQRIAADHGWTFREIGFELARRGVSDRWQFDSGISILFDDDEFAADRERGRFANV